MDAPTRILDAADELFGEVGFDATTTRRIAESAGVNKALIHYHFKSKDELLERLLDRYYGRLSEVLLVSSGGDGSDLRQRFCDLIDTYVDFMVANTNFSRIVQREATGGRHIQVIERHMTEVFAVLLAEIVDRFPESVGTELDPADVLLSFHGMIIELVNYGTALQHVIGEDPLAPDRVEQRKRHLHLMVDLVIDGIDRITGERPGSA